MAHRHPRVPARIRRVRCRRVGEQVARDRRLHGTQRVRGGSNRSGTEPSRGVHDQERTAQADDDVSLDPADGGTLFRRHVDIPVQGRFRLMKPVMARVARRRNARFVENLKRLLEPSTTRRPRGSGHGSSSPGEESPDSHSPMVAGSSSHGTWPAPSRRRSSACRSAARTGRFSRPLDELTAVGEVSDAAHPSQPGSMVARATPRAPPRA